MRRVLLFAAFAVCAPCADAQEYRAQDPACDRGETIYINACLKSKLAIEEERLRRLLVDMESYLDEHQRGELQASQGSWLDYRERYCQVIYAMNIDASMRVAEGLSCKILSTAARADEIGRLLDSQTGG